jgi:[CysO sulfur-carrier protein]-S-L-cysteine hydrolase
MTAAAPFGLRDDLREAIVAHARREAPRECCGVLVGTAGRAESAVALTNVAPGNTLYEIDPRELFDLEFRLLPDRGQEIVAVYHSHPASEAWPSATDLALASWPDACYLICSLMDPAAPVVRAFAITDGAARERSIVPA